MTNTDLDDRRAQLDAFAGTQSPSQLPAVQGTAFLAPTERIFGAQQVAVRRDEKSVLQKLKILAAAAGEEWYYRIPVRRKMKDEASGREQWTQDFIEGPSIKLANDLARLYGNCDVDVRVMDIGEAWVIYARFVDLESGFSMTRPFQQRKAQKAMRTDEGRAQDIALQIGVSKAVRNVVTNALQTYADFGFEEARNALVDKIGKRLSEYRDRVLQRLGDINIDPKRAELVVGRASTDWLAPDVARLIAMIKAIADGMASVEDTFPAIEKTTQSTHDPQTGEIIGKEVTQHTKTSHSTPTDRLATAAGGADDESSARAKDHDRRSSAARSDRDSLPYPRAEGEYVDHAMAWISALTDANGGADQWKREKTLRDHCNIAPDVRERMKSALNEKIADLKKKDESSDVQKHDHDLATAAKNGNAALEAAIAKVPEPHRTTLQVAIERRHRPEAAAVDAAKTQAASELASTRHAGRREFGTPND